MGESTHVWAKQLRVNRLSGETTVTFHSELDRTQLKEILLNYIWRQ